MWCFTFCMQQLTYLTNLTTQVQKTQVKFPIDRFDQYEPKGGTKYQVRGRRRYLLGFNFVCCNTLHRYREAAITAWNIVLSKWYAPLSRIVTSGTGSQTMLQGCKFCTFCYFLICYGASKYLELQHLIGSAPLLFYLRPSLLSIASFFPWLGQHFQVLPCTSKHLPIRHSFLSFPLPLLFLGKWYFLHIGFSIPDG